MHHQ